MDKTTAINALQIILNLAYQHMPSGSHLSDMVAHVGAVDDYIKSTHEPVRLEEPEICCFHSNTPNRPMPLSEARGNYSEHNIACQACGDCQ